MCAISLFYFIFFLSALNLTLILQIKPYLNVSGKGLNIFYQNKNHEFVVLKCIKSVQHIIYILPCIMFGGHIGRHLDFFSSHQQRQLYAG